MRAQSGSGFLWRWLAVIALLVGVGAGFGGGYVALQSKLSERDAKVLAAQESATREQAKVEQLTADQSKLQTDIEQLRQQLAQKPQDLGDLTALRSTVSDLQKQVQDLRMQANKSTSLEKALGAVGDVAQKLENDRLLLVEMRKEEPATKEEAKQEWTAIKKLAVQSDTSLGPRADKVLSHLDAYYNWVNTRFASQAESALTYSLTGAADFRRSIDDFWNAVLLIVVDRLDTLVSLSTQG